MDDEVMEGSRRSNDPILTGIRIFILKRGIPKSRFANLVRDA